jgi:hypothetical protein
MKVSCSCHGNHRVRFYTCRLREVAKAYTGLKNPERSPSETFWVKKWGDISSPLPWVFSNRLLRILGPFRNRRKSFCLT